jgi:hypothetical protein
LHSACGAATVKRLPEERRKLSVSVQESFISFRNPTFLLDFAKIGQAVQRHCLEFGVFSAACDGLLGCRDH